MRLPVFLIPLLLALTACQEEVAKSRKNGSESKVGRIAVSSDLIHSQPFVTDDRGIKGRSLALQHCQRCHLFVEPEALPSEIWDSEVLPRMAAFMGMHHRGVKTTVDLGKSAAEKKLIIDAGIYPPGAEMTRKDWKALAAYYIESAPKALEKTSAPASIEPLSELFDEAELGYRQYEPNTTMVSIDEENRRLFIGDLTNNQLSILNTDLTRIQKIKLNSAPVHAEIINDDLWVTEIGVLNPTDYPEGKVMSFSKNGDYFKTTGIEKLTKLRRPTYAMHADINSDGLADVVISEYGNQLGALNYYQAKRSGGYLKTELMREPGAMMSTVRDFNNDGLLDVAAIHGQGREGVYIHYNQGAGNFTSSYALPVPPHFGSASLAFYDFNADGYIDILTTNGDNGDYRAILKPFHGLRIYLNDGKNAFEEHYFFPMNGAYKALAEDFDLDGDLDIAAISMFPDFEGKPEEGFVYLKNDGNLNFKASTIPSVKDGRWMCMDTGDLDGDGDKDIVIGSFIRGPSEAPASYLEPLETKNLPGLVLWNKTKQAAKASEDTNAIKLDPANAAEQHQLGLDRHKQGREAEAIKHLGEAVGLNPENPEMHSSYGIALLGRGEIEQAITHFQKALELQPRNATFYNNLGVSFYQQRNHPDAIKNFHQSLSIEPKWMETKTNLENSLQELAKKLMGEPFLIQNGHPDHATMHAALGNALRDQKDFTEAARHFQWALKLNPNLPPALNNLAWIRATHPDEKMRDGARAVELAERCCELTGYKLNGTLDTLAAAYAEAGRFSEAIRWQTKAIELAGDANANELREQLKLYEAGKPFRK
ncbi:MAG: FG-GAP-like repeat-containing protein [Akkermansiaceae bacterium]